MDTQPPQIPQNPPKKKTNVLLVVAIVLGVGFSGMVVIGGLLAAIAIPALAGARAAAQVAVAQKVVKVAETAIDRYEQTNGKTPESWDDLQSLLTFKGQVASSPNQFLKLARLPEGSVFEIRGINGASQTLIRFPDGKVVTSKGWEGVGD